MNINNKWIKNNNIVYIVIKIIIYNNKFLYNIKFGIKYNIYKLFIDNIYWIINNENKDNINIINIYFIKEIK